MVFQGNNICLISIVIKGEIIYISCQETLVISLKRLDAKTN
jgi:hypothetical protein